MDDETIEKNSYLEEDSGVLFHLHNQQETTNILPDAKYSYTYPGLELLDSSEPAPNDSTKVHICAYYVNTSAKSPFLQFILQKHDAMNGDIVIFPTFYSREDVSILEYSNMIVETIYSSYKLTNGAYEYKGYLKEDGNMYLFYDFTTCIIGIQELYRKNDVWLVTMDEIINHARMCNFPIGKDVTEFFIDHLDFLYLRDIDNNILEIPTIAYNGTSSRKVNFMLYFGASACDKHFLNGPHYYFTDYHGAKMDAVTEYKNDTMKSTNVYSKYGIVRSVLFLGTMKFYTDVTEEHNNDYDSVYIRSDITGGSPMWGVKDYAQQCPISSHYFENEEDSYII